MNDEEKLNTIKEALKDWEDGVLNNFVALVAIKLTVDQPDLTDEQIEKGQEIADRIENNEV
mgnify:CR=1 FL=1